MDDNTKKSRRLFFWAKPKTQKAQPAIADSWWNSWQGWVRIILLFFALEIAVLSIEQAHWITPQPLLTLVLILSIVVTAVLIRIRLWGVFKHVIILVVGLAITLWQTLNCIEPSEATSKFSHLLNIFQSWIRGSEGLLPGDDKIIFVVFITLVTWLIGYLSTWFLLRRHNAWVAVVLGAVMLLFNLSNLPDSYYIYFILYFFAAMLLLAVTRMIPRTPTEKRTPGYSINSLSYLGISLLCITAIAASFSWITPQARATSLQNWISTSMPWQNDLMESKINIFNAIPSKQALNTASIMKDLTFGQNWNQGDEVKYVIISERPSYWRMNVYDTYTIKGWTNSSTRNSLLEANTNWSENNTYSNQEMMQYAVINGIRTNVLFISGDFASSDIPVEVIIGTAGEVMAVTTLRIYDPGERYMVNSYVSTANETDLSAASQDYPFSVRMVYLQLPNNLSSDIRLLSENITSNATTAYAKVRAVLGFLSQYTYKMDVQTPPEGVDNIEYFLFTKQEGYCLHFASAAVVMLRSIGIPARLAVGYLPGDPGKMPGQYIVLDKYYHAWPQVYFPEYGWLDIEATPGGPASRLTSSTPLVSSPSLEEPPNWEAWIGTPPPLFYNLDKIDIGNIQRSDTTETDSLSFAAKLGRALLFVLIAALIIALLVGLVLVIRAFSFRWLWRVDRNAVAYGTYTNMCRLAAMVGLVPTPQQTPLEFTTELVKTMPQEAKAVNYITRVYMENRFGGREGKPEVAEEAEILKARHIVYHTLIKRMSVMSRLFGKR